jgi:hypothetical protein
MVIIMDDNHKWMGTNFIAHHGRIIEENNSSLVVVTKVYSNKKLFQQWKS